jgi:hypothetical protein
MPRLRTSLLLTVTILAMACSNRTTRMTSLPSEGTQRNANAHGTVVLFRVTTDSAAGSVEATLSTLPHWKWHYLVNVALTGKPLGSGQAFGAGQLDPAPRDAGWGFVTLPAGTYQLAFAAYRTRFAMAGSQRAALGFGQSSSAQLEVPADAAIVYVGTFAFACHKADRGWGYVEHECTKLEVRDERELALQVASGSLSRFAPMQTTLASLTAEERVR